MIKIKNYHDLVRVMRELDVNVINLRTHVVFRKRRAGLDYEVSRDYLPQKGATAAQCQAVYEDILDQLEV